MTSDIVVTKAPRQFEITVDGTRAGLVTYRDLPGVRSFMHTEIDDAFQGKGLAKRLIQEALETTRDAGMSVLPYCEAVLGFISKNPEYLDLVPVNRRSEFELD